MTKRVVHFGIIGCGLMGREFASAVSRWCHLLDVNYIPVITAVCDVNLDATTWFTDHLASIEQVTDNYRELLDNKRVEAVYCAIPHHLHEQYYLDIIRAEKHLLGEKPFGIDKQANQAIQQAIVEHPHVLVRCSSELPFYPGALKVYDFVKEGLVGKVIDVEAGFWHSSDLNPLKPINWKRKVSTNGAYGCMGDLGLHTLHLPLRLGWKPRLLSASLSNLVEERPDHTGQAVPCETWDNATLLCEVDSGQHTFPMVLSMKRIAPGHANTWFIRINGMLGSIEYSTQNPKQLKIMRYTAGGRQVWGTEDIEYHSAYTAITGNIFEFGFSDSILQMWSAFCDELVNGADMIQPFYCATPDEAAYSHELFTAVLDDVQNRISTRS
ncbi:Gfo/Idh/MocA family protein [Paenibacillus thalictri]|uniref:Gfo/Idh/MocA family oxidoreductase n=1 Tax=Paenibacillus thalictri TaxID=2527873 RepID=A0A4V6MSE8_9BACL|nr:Gfo/Idh/MocA family oxidoreductase [Paenibacillus thalictri]TBL74642.1 Gfo/Idh/MocA family oxidoreductase [Paenibacillus thalictri]